MYADLLTTFLFIFVLYRMMMYLCASNYKLPLHYESK